MKTMRVAIVGAGGQVGSEVTLQLSGVPGVEVVPMVRSRSGSAFLRYHGVRVLHGDITDPADARRCLDGADLVANFALAGGTPRQISARNAQIIRVIFDQSNGAAKLVFFSTLAVHGSVTSTGEFASRTAYGDLKLSNERLIARLARDREVFVLRLGHVAGEFQGLNEVCREDILASPVLMPDPERPSNVTHTATISDALLAIGQGRAAIPGRYDLLNVPQWTWRQVYEREASNLGVPLTIVASRDSSHGGEEPISRFLFRLVARQRVKSFVLRVLGKLPFSFDPQLRAQYYIDRARREIALLNPSPSPRNPATLWPAVRTHSMPGLRQTAELLESKAFSVGTVSAAGRWPSDGVSRP